MALALSVALSFLAYGLTRSQLLNEREGSLVGQAYLNARVARSALRASDPDVPALLRPAHGGPATHAPRQAT